MITTKLKQHLDAHNTKYTTSHSPAFTAMEVAAMAHVPGKQLAKVVIMKLESRLAMAVLPSNYRINSSRMMQALHTANMRLADESEFERKFRGCELGAMPPFGNLYGMQTFVSKSLAEDEYITFSAGTHSEVITLLFEDFRMLVRPKVISFTDRFMPEETKRDL